MADEIVWEEPPSDSRIRWAETLDALRRHPGEWARFACHRNAVVSATARVEGKFEVVQRHVDGERFCIRPLRGAVVTTAEDHAREVVKDTLGIDLTPYQLVERDAEGNTYREGVLSHDGRCARRLAMALNSGRPSPSRWWAVMGPEGWEK